MYDSGLSHPFGLATGDLALLAGGLALLAAMLLLGLSGNRRGRRRWLAKLGWLTLTVSFVAIGFGTIRSSASSNQTPA